MQHLYTIRPRPHGHGHDKDASILHTHTHTHAVPRLMKKKSHTQMLNLLQRYYTRETCHSKAAGDLRGNKKVLKAELSEAKSASFHH